MKVFQNALEFVIAEQIVNNVIQINKLLMGEMMKKNTTVPLFFAFLIGAFIVGPVKVAAQENELKSILTRVKPATVLVWTFNAMGKTLAQGSGFFVSSKGEVITSYNLLKNAEKAVIRYFDGNAYRIYKITSVVAEDMMTDLIKLQADTGEDNVQWLQLNKVLVEIGEKILVIGNSANHENTMSNGIVSAVKDLPGYSNIIQITALISPGFNGSAVINMKGEVIGVASAQIRDGQNFVVPVEKIIALKEKKRALAPGYLAPSGSPKTRTKGHRFINNNNGTVTDTRTNLIWLKNANPCGQKNGYEAVAYCRKLASGQVGLTDNSKAGEWRLPSLQELEEIGTYPLATREYFPSVKWTKPGSPFTNVQSDNYWSGTGYADGTNSSWVVNLKDGTAFDIHDSDNNTYVWPVRDSN